ncbi:hypothetical protein [Citromicrobium bathyomarinum]|uniref:hypothetical protein n=1 Tax=Citromicrobium bathyomarinum TaxID=72174 RepID=UPI00315A2EEA
MTDSTEAERAESIAARRYWMLQFIRLGGIFVTFTGAMMVAGRIDGGELGPVLFVAGPLLFFAVPVLLAKHWKRENR